MIAALETLSPVIEHWDDSFTRMQFDNGKMVLPNGVGLGVECR